MARARKRLAGAAGPGEPDPAAERRSLRAAHSPLRMGKALGGWFCCLTSQLSILPTELYPGRFLLPLHLSSKCLVSTESHWDTGCHVLIQRLFRGNANEGVKGFPGLRKQGGIRGCLEKGGALSPAKNNG